MPNLTERTVERVPVPETGYSITWDTRVPGLGLRVTSGGVRAWILQYRVRGSRRARKATLGRTNVLKAAQARAMGLDWLGRARQGEDPGARSTSPTVKELVELYRARHAPTKKPRSRAEDERMLSKDILPALGRRRLDEIDQGDVEKLLGRITARAPYQANRTRSLLHLLFRLAQRWGLADRNPVEHVARNRESARERLLSDAEMGALGKALAEVEQANPRTRPACDALRLLALSGARLREILHLRWEEVDLDAGLLRLSDSKTGARPVYLAPPAVAILARQERRSGWVFPSYCRDGRPLNDVRGAWEAACKKAKIEKARPHDLRHRFASSAARSGFSALEIKPLTGHRNVKTLERYVHAEAAPARRAAERVGELQAALLEGRSAEVVSIEERRR
jgi:integrase